MKNKEKIFAVAPMMDWTDRHCRTFHRQISAHTRLYTEMLTADAIIHGDREKLLGFDSAEQPVALQIGGSEPEKLAEAARIGAEFGYSEINLNCGCPSDRVQSGRFGACLMAEPELVAEGVAAMRAAVDIPVTVKCRIGIDDQDTEDDLQRFVEMVVSGGIDGLIVHARKAWLGGLSPKENRDVPPLDYDRVYRLKERWPDLSVTINGGVASLAEACEHLEMVDGVMMGRSAYRNPFVLAEADRQLFSATSNAPSRAEITRRMLPYVEAQLAQRTPLIAITRHMLGLYHGQPGGRHWRRILSEEGRVPGAGIEVVERALDTVEHYAARAMAA